ncbi:MAG TPA: response regulator [Usitatibacter sp.]|nr:response regulator [Usitatibacter sp.]
MARVLIVEDNAALQKIYVTLLTKEGYDVDFASDGRVALEKAEKRPPDLILLDMMMPNLDGVGFLRAYDLQGKHPGVKVVVFSNTEVPGKVKEALELGASRYMTKYNFTPKDMVGLIRDMLKA